MKLISTRFRALLGRRLRSVAILIAVLILTTNARADTVSNPTHAVHALLDRSAAAWNRGDLDTFMRSYERSPVTVYISSHAVIHGYANIRAHYASAHPGAMGALTFSQLAIRPLGVDYAVVVARWHLAMANGTKPTGLFTLVLHRSAAGWGIITDHSP
jgi:ketosteroid isomerase-like protein